MEVLEPRVMLSATPLVAIDVDSEAVAGLSSDQQADSQSKFDSANRLDSEAVSDSRMGTVFVVIDASVSDLRDYLDLESLEDEDTRVETILVGSDEDGFQRIETLLEATGDVEALHIVSHGNDGVIRLGNATLSVDSLDDYGESISSWRNSLRDEADILIYGCNVAESEEGRRLTQGIAALSGADVAASEDITGHNQIGGDWDLEYQVGSVESSIAFELDRISNWAGQLVQFEIQGTVFDDQNGDGEVSGDSGAEGVEVLLFQDDGDGVISAGDTNIEKVSTDSNGVYRFTLADNVTGQFYVVVDSKTIKPATGFNSGFDQDDIWAVQTYATGDAFVADGAGGTEIRSGTTAYGGRQAGVSDDAASHNLLESQHVTRVIVTNANVANVDFGFSFNVVTNVLGGDNTDHDSSGGRSIQGSLRQFIQNSNAISGANEMRFVPVGDPTNGTAGNQYWRLNITEVLPTISDDQTTIDGTAFQFLNGTQERNLNSNVVGTVTTVGLGADGLLGTGDEFSLTGVQAPDLQLDTVQSNNTDYGLNVELVDNTIIRRIAIRDFGDIATDLGANILIQNASNTTIDSVVIGVHPDHSGGFSSVNNGGNLKGISVQQSNGGVIRNSIIAGSGQSGIKIHGSQNYLVEENEITRNARNVTNRDGMDLSGGTTNVTVRRNFVHNNFGGGIDSFNGGGNFSITENTVESNGFSGSDERAGIRLFGPDNSVTLNRIANNGFDGVLVMGGSVQATNTLISKNSFEGNQRSIDLTASRSTSAGDGRDAIDGVNSNRGNFGFDRPTLTSARLVNGRYQLDITGPWPVPPKIEVYIASDSASTSGNSTASFGEGGTYAVTLEHNGTEYVATDFGANPVAGDFLTAIAIDSDGNTSEFSNNVEVTIVGNQAASLSIDNLISSLPESTDTSSAIKIGDVIITDDGRGSNTLSLSGADASLFFLDGNSLMLNAGVSLDFETKANLNVTVEVDDPAVTTSPDDSVAVVLNVTDVNEAPSAALNNVTSVLDQAVDTSSAIKLADIQITDDALGTNSLSLSGANAGSFEIVGNELRLRAGTILTPFSSGSLSVDIVLDDPSLGSGPEQTLNYVLSVVNSSTAPTVSLDNLTTSLDEGADTTSSVKVADIVITDDGLGVNRLSLSGRDASEFEILGSELHLRSGINLDFETQAFYDVTVQVDDANVGTTPDDSVDFRLAVNDLNEAPSVTLSNVVASLPEDLDTSARVRVADIAVSDDALGTNTLTVVGRDQQLFEIDGNTLFLRSGAELDHEAVASLRVGVRVADATLAASLADQQNVAIDVTDVNESPFVRSDAPTQIEFAEDDSLRVNVSDWFGDQDSNDNQLTYEILALSNTSISARLLGDGETIRLTGEKNFNGQGTITLRAVDSSNAFVDFAIDTNVLPVNDTFQPLDREMEGNGTETITGTLLPVEQDVDGEQLSIQIVNPPEQGELTILDDGSFEFNPNGFIGDTSFEFVVDDGVAVSAPATVELTVSGSGVFNTPIQEAPARSISPPESRTQPERPVESPAKPTPPATPEAPRNEAPASTPDQAVGPAPQSSNQAENPSEQVTAEVTGTDDVAGVSEVSRDTVGSSGSRGESSRHVSFFRTQRADRFGSESFAAVTQSFDVGLEPEFASALFGERSVVWEKLDELEQESQAVSFTHFVTGSVGSATSSLIVGYVIWGVRSGLLMSSVMASMPAWRFLDPIEILPAGGDDESLQDIVESRREEVDEDS